MADPYYQDDSVSLYHGDALELAELWTCADVLVTDPPYGMAYHSGRRKADDRIACDDTLTVRDAALDHWAAANGEGAPALVFGTWKQPRPDRVRQLIVWDKRGGAGFSGDLNMPWADITEEVYVIGTGWAGRRVPAIYSIPTIPSQSPARNGHPTPKPTSLMEALIAKCPPGIIADPFAGSGSTLVAAKALGRRAIGVELEERYCETAAKRLAQDVLDFGAVS